MSVVACRPRVTIRKMLTCWPSEDSRLPLSSLESELWFLSASFSLKYFALVIASLAESSHNVDLPNDQELLVWRHTAITHCAVRSCRDNLVRWIAQSTIIFPCLLSNKWNKLGSKWSTFRNSIMPSSFTVNYCFWRTCEELASNLKTQPFWFDLITVVIWCNLSIQSIR